MLVFCNVIDNVMMALILGLAQMSLKMLGLHGENEKMLQNVSYK